MQKIISLLIGTRNNGKFREITAIIEGLHPKVFSLKSLREFSLPDVPETGKTFCENSLLKARYYGSLSKLPTLADDGGLEIDTLEGEPGIHSRRWPGYAATDEELIAFTLKKLDGIPPSRRTARLTTCITLFDPFKKTWLQEKQSIVGKIAETVSNHKIEGYPYKSLFVVERFKKYYGDLTAEEHARVNHRRIALERLLTRFLKRYATMQS